MRFYKEQQYYMLRKVKTLLEKKKDLLSSKAPVLGKLIDEYLDRFGAIEKMISGKLKTIRIDTSEKRTAKEGLIEAVMKLVAVLRTHHSSYDSKEMPEEAGYTVAVLKRASVAKLSDRCIRIISEAKKVNNLRDYGLSVGDIKEAEAYFHEFTSVKTAPQQRRGEIAKRNLTINKGIATCIIFLENKIDPMMRIATEGNKELRFSYLSRRKVLARGRGNISDKEARYRKSRGKGRMKRGAES